MKVGRNKLVYKLFTSKYHVTLPILTVEAFLSLLNSSLRLELLG
jgi:hypothetical protein